MKIFHDIKPNDEILWGTSEDSEKLELKIYKVFGNFIVAAITEKEEWPGQFGEDEGKWRWGIFEAKAGNILTMLEPGHIEYNAPDDPKEPWRHEEKDDMN